MSEEERKILATAAAGDGLIVFVRPDVGIQIFANGDPVVPENATGKTVAVWRDALDNLIAKGLIKPDSAGDDYRQTFRLTAKGFDAVKA